MASTSLLITDDDQEEEDYYGFFNIQRNATEDNIVKAYRRLSKLYHPDRHTNVQFKEEAEKLFRKTRKIYETLMDPQKRRIYDTVGVKGLEIGGWEVVERMMGPEEVRAEYERLVRLKEEQLYQETINPSGGVSLSFNAVEWFQKSLDDEVLGDEFEFTFWDWLEKLELTEVAMAQTVDAPLTVSDRLSFAGGISSRNGVGTANLSGSWRRLWGQSMWGIGRIGVGNNLFGSYKLVLTISKNTIGTVTLSCNNENNNLNPGISTSIQTQLDHRLTGVMKLSLGSQNVFLIKLMHVDIRRENHFSCGLSLSQRGSHVSLIAQRRFKEDAGDIRGAIQLGAFGVILQANYMQKISQYNRIGCSCLLQWPQGNIHVKFKFLRAHQEYTTDFLICDDADYFQSTLLYGVILPMTVSQIIGMLLRPYWTKWRSTSTSKVETERNEVLEQKRKEANAAIGLMRETALRIREQEEKKNGLIIVEAWYGELVAIGNSASATNSQRTSSDSVIDVGVPLQVLVKDSKLLLYDAKKSQLPGLFDPCPGIEKKLKVLYKFRGSIHSVTVDDAEPLLIPKQSHAVSNGADVSRR